MNRAETRKWKMQLQNETTVGRDELIHWCHTSCSRASCQTCVILHSHLGCRLPKMSRYDCWAHSCFLPGGYRKETPVFYWTTSLLSHCYLLPIFCARFTISNMLLCHCFMHYKQLSRRLDIKKYMAQGNWQSPHLLCNLARLKSSPPSPGHKYPL